jgi:hypothetical protein
MQSRDFIGSPVVGTKPLTQICSLQKLNGRNFGDAMQANATLLTGPAKLWMQQETTCQRGALWVTAARLAGEPYHSPNASLPATRIKVTASISRNAVSGTRVAQ